MEAMTSPPESCMMGSEMPKKDRIAEPTSWMTAKKRMVLMAMRAGEGAIDTDGLGPDEAEEDERGAERVDQREEREKASTKLFQSSTRALHEGD